MGDQEGGAPEPQETSAPAGEGKSFMTALLLAILLANLCIWLAVHGKLPEPLRSAHIIAGGIATGESRHRA